MNLLVWIIMIVVFFYTTGFALTLWREQNRAGSIAIFVLAMAIVITPFFSVFR